MNENNCLNPKKKLKQMSIEDYFISSDKKTTNSSQLLDEKEVQQSIDRNSNDSIIASTSTSKVNNSQINGFETQFNEEIDDECVRMEIDSFSNNSFINETNECLTQTSDQSIDGNNSSQMSCCLSQIPETPQLLFDDHLDDDFDDHFDDHFDDEIDLLLKVNRIPECLLPLSQLRPDSSHYVLYCVPLVHNSVPKPYPQTYESKWDSRHVKMPNDSRNQIIAINIQNGLKNSSRVSKWDLIQENLLSDIESSKQLEEKIKTFNPFMKKYNFDVLHSLFNKEFKPEERINFFDEILPKLIELTLRLPSIVTQSVPLLRQKQNATLFLSQLQIASLLANAFFCTFPKRSQTNEEFKNYPIINFLGLFTNYDNNEYPKTKIEKLKCILNYFRRILKETPKGIVSFERRYLSDEELPDWQNSNKELKKLIVMKNGLIEREGSGLLQVDFANKYVGGGVIGSGCVQEEIRFVICPELIISRLFTEKLLDNEVLIISGCEQFNSYSGYANTFCWESDYIDNTASDEWGRRCTRIAVIDALYFSYDQKDIQFETKFINRELNKSYCGFMERRRSLPINKSGIASGNWGCGAFNGDPKLKAIIQLMSASEAERDLVLFTFNDIHLKIEFERFYEFISCNRFNVKHLYKALKLYQQNRNNSKLKQNIDIFKFIYDSKDLILGNF